MSFGFFGKKKSAAIACDRLRLVLERERQNTTAPLYFDAMQAEIIEAVRAVIKKYADTERIEVKSQDDISLEIEIVLEKKTL